MATPAVQKKGRDTAQSAAEQFFRYFQGKITELQEQMDRLGDIALVGERKDKIDHCLGGIIHLSTKVEELHESLPAHDLGTYREAIKALKDRLDEARRKHEPKPKFTFKTRKNDSAVSLQDVAELAAGTQGSMFTYSTVSGTSSAVSTPGHTNTPPAGSTSNLQSTEAVDHNQMPDDKSTKGDIDSSQRPALTTTATSTIVSSETSAHIIIPASASRAQCPCTLSTLDSCFVDLSVPMEDTAPFASLTITDVKSSLLVCGSIAGPAHITGVRNSSILISCRQFRMHECHNVDVYLYCTSRPIIESCNEVRFAEMPRFYTDLLHSVHPNPNEAIGTNMWEHVDDFKWLRSEQSPNWMTLPSEEQMPEANWKEIIAGKPGLSLEEILSAALNGR